jgi:hypothetical protein
MDWKTVQFLAEEKKVFFSAPSNWFCNSSSLISSGYMQPYLQRVKWSEHESDHSPPTRAKFKNVWHYTSILFIQDLVLY